MSKLLISACLLGQKVRHDAQGKLQNNARLDALVKAGRVISVCPEMAGGLPAPRPPAEIQPGKSAQEVLEGKGKILTIDHQDVTSEFVKGANLALALTLKHNIRVAILKARSPSCGSNGVYDGTHSHTLISGMGITAKLLTEHGIRVFDESEIDQALDLIESEDPQ